jgi:hypothetical protein
MQTPRTTTAVLAAAGIIVAGAGCAWADSAEPEQDLTSAEETFTFLTGEEKLAHDVYTTLGEQYDARQFDTIATSETNHLEAMRTVLDSMGVADPTAGDDLGAFDDPQLQQLYDTYVAQGEESLAAAAAVGIAIEEADIVALTAALDIAPDEHATKVLEQQIAASKRHLAAFQRLADGCDSDCTGNGPGSGGNQGPQGNGAEGGGSQGSAAGQGFRGGGRW